MLSSFYIYKDRDVAMIVTHPAFESKRIWNDVGVLFVRQDFEVADHISPVCIPSNPDDDSEYMSENCVATGWGRNKYGKGLNGLIMLRFTSNNRKWLIEIRWRLRINIKEGFFANRE